MSKAFCTECEKDVDYDVKLKHNVPRLIAGKTYIARDFYICTCDKCKKAEVQVPIKWNIQK